MTRHRDRASDLETFTSDLAPVVRRGQGLGGLISSATPAPVDRGTETELSPSEIDALVQAEAIIERGLKTFVEVGNALTRIRTLELYRVEYRTFEAYCADRWGISRPRAYELMGASQVVSAIADISDDMPAVQVLPQNEAQTRPLTRLKSPALQREAWQRVVETAPDRHRITSAHVKAIVDTMLVQTDHPPAGTSTANHTPLQQGEVSILGNEEIRDETAESLPSPQVAIPDNALPAMDVSALQQRVAELEQQRDSLAAALRAAGWDVESPEQLGHIVEGVLTERAVVGERWRAINDLLHDHAGWLATARQQTDDGHGGQLGQTMRKLLALVDAIAAKVS